MNNKLLLISLLVISFFKPITSFSQSGNAALEIMPVNESVMVTVDLDLGKPVPSIAQALNMIERKYQPADKQGRTFAILDAYGEPTADGKLHMSMHISSEKEGIGQLILKSTGKVLWNSRIEKNPNKPYTGEPKKLTIYIDYDGKKSLTVDGSTNPATVFDAKLKENNALIRDFWKEGQEKELTFVFSACGCPVHIKAKRLAGNKSKRTSDLPVMFPDDPAVMTVISRLMGW